MKKPSHRTIALSTALCLPTLDIEALLQGRTLAALSHTFRNPSYFLLCPVDVSLDTAQINGRYRIEFLRSLRSFSGPANPDTVVIQAWAQHKTCRTYGSQDNLIALSKLTAWSPEYLHDLVKTHHNFFLVLLQVHRFPQPIELRMNRPEEDKLGSYITVPGTWSDQNTRSLIDDKTFAYRQKRLIKLLPPRHPELENLQSDLVATRESSLGAMSLDRDIRYLLGWSRAEETQLYDSDLSWIRKITQVGQSTDETEFKKLIHKSLTKLGFSIIAPELNDLNDELDYLLNPTYDPKYAHKTATEPTSESETNSINNDEPNHNTANLSTTDLDATDLDATDLDATDLDTTDPDAIDQDVTDLSLCCYAPYLVIGKFKANQQGSIPNPIVEQLILLANSHLSREQLQKSVKILFAAGALTEQAQQSANRHHINIMRPQTLQRLSELKAQHPGAIDLLKLKQCLQTAPYGEDADKKINLFITDTLQQLKVRSALIQAVKNCMERTGQESASKETICAAYAALLDKDLPSLSIQEVHFILVELASPVAGYVGRKQLENGRTVFYFLRELSVTDTPLTASLI